MKKNKVKDAKKLPLQKQDVKVLTPETLTQVDGGGIGSPPPGNYSRDQC